MGQAICVQIPLPGALHILETWSFSAKHLWKVPIVQATQCNHPKEEESPSLEAGPDGRHMPVHAPLGPANAQGHGALQQAGEDLYLVRAAVLGDLEPLHQELSGENMRLCWGPLANPESVWPAEVLWAQEGGSRTEGNRERSVVAWGEGWYHQWPLGKTVISPGPCAQ